MKNFITEPVVVPKNYVGMSSEKVDVIPSTFTVGTVRSWDFVGSGGSSGTTNCIVKFINPSNGVYHWTEFDKLFQNADRQIIFVLGQPADYLVTRTATGSAYMGGKANMVPDNMSGWVTVVEAIVNRAKTQFGRTGLIWELWNETDIPASFNDSVALFGPYAKATAEAIKAIDPTAVIVGPSAAGGATANANIVADCMVASDGAGGIVADHCDGLSLHAYVQQTAQISTMDNPLAWVLAYLNFTSIMKNRGIELPVYLTESGVLLADPDGGRKYAMRLLTYAALGCKVFIGYRYDSTVYGMDTYQTAWNYAANLLPAGAVITEFVPGPSKLKITIDGVEHVI